MEENVDYSKAADIIKVIAHPERLKIISILEKKKLNVQKIQEELGIKQSITSQHLNSMAARGILKRVRKGNSVFYSIKRKEVLKLMSCIRGCCSWE